MLNDSNESPHVISPSVTKTAMFEPRHHGHRLFKPRHHGHRISAIRNEHMYNKIVVSQRHNQRSTEKDKKEPTGKDHEYESRSDEDLYFTFDAEYAVRTRSASSKITHFLKESIGWMIESETENDKNQETFLRGGSIDPYEEW